jgi:hypothetical protein
LQALWFAFCNLLTTKHKQMANQKGDTFLQRWAEHDTPKYYAFIFITNLISATIGSVLTTYLLIPKLQQLGWI